MLDTVLKDSDIHTKTILLAERELQLKEYNHIREQIRERENRELDILKDHFSNQFQYPEYASNEFESIREHIRSGLKVMGYVDIIELIDYAIQKTANDSRGDYHNVAAAKYLFGILKNKLKEGEKHIKS
ncbi:MAG: hypothetical protein ACYSUB_16450 [Planctomycetota bacterium]